MHRVWLPGHRQCIPGQPRTPAGLGRLLRQRCAARCASELLCQRPLMSSSRPRCCSSTAAIQTLAHPGAPTSICWHCLAEDVIPRLFLQAQAPWGAAPAAGQAAAAEEALEAAAVEEQQSPLPAMSSEGESSCNSSSRNSSSGSTAVSSQPGQGAGAAGWRGGQAARAAAALLAQQPLAAVAGVAAGAVQAARAGARACWGQHGLPRLLLEWGVRCECSADASRP